jgi:hypothetical protein
VFGIFTARFVSNDNVSKMHSSNPFEDLRSTTELRRIEVQLVSNYIENYISLSNLKSVIQCMV